MINHRQCHTGAQYVMRLELGGSPEQPVLPRDHALGVALACMTGESEPENYTKSPHISLHTDGRRLSTASAPSTGLVGSDSNLSAASDVHQMTAASGMTEYQEDKYIFKHAGRRFKEHLKKFGEGLHFGGMFGSSSSASEPDRSQFELERIPADDFEDITRLIWSAFRVPFSALTMSKDGRQPVPVILSLLKVVIDFLFPW